MKLRIKRPSRKSLKEDDAPTTTASLGPYSPPKLGSMLRRKRPVVVEGSVASTSIQPWKSLADDGASIVEIYDEAKRQAESKQGKLDRILKRASAGAAKIIITIKPFASFVDKLDRGKSIDGIHDVLRAAVLMPDDEGVERVVRMLRKTQKIVEYEHKSKGEDPNFGYYGSHHFKIMIDDLICEVIVLTRRLWVYKCWAHDEIYNKFRNSKTVEPDAVERSKKKSKQIFAIGNAARTYSSSNQKPKTFAANSLYNEEIIRLKGLGLRRSEMPQIAKKDFDEFILYLDNYGVTHRNTTIRARSLKPVQDEIDSAKVDSLPLTGLDKALLVSSDNYIIDGHHRWQQAVWFDKSLPVMKFNIKIRPLLALVSAFDKAQFRDVHSSPATP